MDDFALDRPELNGSLMSLEFGSGGRIHQLWVTDPSTPDETEEFQFVAPPVTMGEELAEDYYPGTILLGARTDPDDPWIVSRNTRAEQVGDPDDGSTVVFGYEFSFLEELEANGRFYEIPGRIPQIVWELTIRNRNRRSIEIGELGFPLALNNVLDGYPRDDRGVRELFHDRVQVHKFIGGSASYIYAQRMHNAPPGLLIYPGGDTKWEFYNHVPASLNSTFQWEGVPVVYVHSRAAIEREEWPEWFYGHTSTVLEPGESRQYEMRFAPGDPFFADPQGSLSAVGRPAMRLFPAAVAPIDSTIALDVGGATPTRFWTDGDAEMDSDSDEEGGVCVLRTTTSGTLRVGFEDTVGRTSETQVLFTKPIAELILARAEWIVENQVVRSGPIAGAIVSADNETGDLYSDLRHFTTSFTIKSSLGEALFLAEKNTAYPEPSQIQVLDDYLENFLERKIRNPSDGSVGCVMPSQQGTAACFGYPAVYPLCTLLYASMARIAKHMGGTRRSAIEYLRKGAETATALWKHALADPMAYGSVPLVSYLPDFADQLQASGLEREAEEIRRLLDHRWTRLARREYAFASGGNWEADGFEEVLAAARHVGDLELKDRVFRCLLAGRSSSPCWWWYGSDKRWGPGADGNDAAVDNGELCLGTPTVANSGLLFSLFMRDYAHLPDGMARLAFGGMLGVWALVREDGAAGMAFCPDAASGHFGMAATTGDIGIALYHYLRWAGAYVLPTLGTTLAVFAASFEVDDRRGVEAYVVRPWDGVGRRVIVRQIGLEVECPIGRIAEVRFDADKRRARISIQNDTGKDLQTEVVVRGLWGRRCIAEKVAYEAVDGAFRIAVGLSAHDSTHIDIEVSE